MRLGNGRTQGDISASHSPATTLWGRLGRQLSIRMRCLSVCLCDVCTRPGVLCLQMCGEFERSWYFKGHGWKLSSTNERMCNCSFRIHDEGRNWRHFRSKETQRHWGITRTASREEVDQAGVAGFTNYQRTAEELSRGWIRCHAHYIFTQPVSATLSAKYHVAVV